MPPIQVGVGVESDLMNLSVTTDDMSLEELAAFTTENALRVYRISA